MTRRIPRLSVLVVLPLLAALALTPAVQAEPPGPPPGPPGARLKQHLNELGLTADQMKKVDSILSGEKGQRQKFHTQMKEAFDQMHNLLKQDSPNESAVMQQADKIGQIQTAMHKAMLHTLLQVRAVLTPAQRQKLIELSSKEGSRWHHHHRGGPKDGGAKKD